MPRSITKYQKAQITYFLFTKKLLKGQKVHSLCPQHYLLKEYHASRLELTGRRSVAKPNTMTLIVMSHLTSQAHRSSWASGHPRQIGQQDALREHVDLVPSWADKGKFFITQRQVFTQRKERRKHLKDLYTEKETSKHVGSTTASPSPLIMMHQNMGNENIQSNMCLKYTVKTLLEAVERYKDEGSMNDRLNQSPIFGRKISSSFSY